MDLSIDTLNLKDPLALASLDLKALLLLLLFFFFHLELLCFVKIQKDLFLVICHGTK